MTTPTAIERIGRSGIVAILRSLDGDVLVDAAHALLAGGVDVVEVTFTVPHAERVIARMSDALGDRILLGAGTVLDPETARAAMLAGAEFIVAPTLNLEVIKLCCRYGTAVIPGALTPTEVLTAWESGAHAVKIFPSEITGPAYLKAIAGPLPQVRLMPTGGVTLDTAAGYLQAGAYAVGIGGALVDGRSLASRDFAGIERRSRQFVDLVAAARASRPNR